MVNEMFDSNKEIAKNYILCGVTTLLALVVFLITAKIVGVTTNLWILFFPALGVGVFVALLRIRQSIMKAEGVSRKTDEELWVKVFVWFLVFVLSVVLILACVAICYGVGICLVGCELELVGGVESYYGLETATTTPICLVTVEGGQQIVFPYTDCKQMPEEGNVYLYEKEFFGLSTSKYVVKEVFHDG